jgi:hypothetical protein
VPDVTDVTVALSLFDEVPEDVDLFVEEPPLASFISELKGLNTAEKENLFITPAVLAA